MDTRIEKQNLPHSKLEKEEDILEKLFLCKQNGIEMKIEKICHFLQIEKRSLLPYLKSLQKHGYIEAVIPEQEIQLTDYGLSVGNNYIYRHNSISQMLQFIGVNEKNCRSGCVQNRTHCNR